MTTHLALDVQQLVTPPIQLGDQLRELVTQPGGLRVELARVQASRSLTQCQLSLRLFRVSARGD